jgi:O-antigen ligase
VPPASRPNALEAVHLGAIVLTPWFFGGSPDPVRYGLAFLLLVVNAVWLARARTLRSDVLLPAAALGAWGLLPALGVGPSPVSTLESAILLVAGLANFVFWTETARDTAAATRLSYAILLAAAAQAAFGVVQESSTPGRLYGEAMVYAKAPYGSYVTHTHFAGLMEMAIWLSLGLALGRARQHGRIDPFTVACVGLALALAGAHLASRSRGGLFALLVGGAAFVPLWRLARSRSRPSRVELPATVIVVLVALAFAWLAVPASTRAHLTTLFHGPTDGSGQYRVNIAAATLQLWKSHPVTGSSLGTYEDLVTRFKRSHGLERSAHAESDALEFTAEAGLVGLGLLAWLAAAAGRGTVDRLRESRDPWRKGMTVGAIAGVVCLLAHSFVDFNLRGSPANALVFAALAGLAAAPRSEPRWAVPRGIARAVAALTLVLAAAALWRSVGAAELWYAHRAPTPDETLARLSTTLTRHPYIATASFERAHLRWWLARGRRDLVRFRLEGAKVDLETALRVRPAWGNAWNDLGWVTHLLGDNAAAARAFERAGELDPASARIGESRAEFFFTTGSADKGLQELHRIRRYNPEWSVERAQSVASRWNVEFK